MNIDFPFRFNGQGRTEDTDQESHVHDMIEQLLFTSPGERVNRPTFGCGLLRLVFTPNDDELTATTQFLVQSALQQWLGDLIQIDDVLVENEDANLSVMVRYTIRRSSQQQTAQFVRGGAGS